MTKPDLVPEDVIAQWIVGGEWFTWREVQLACALLNLLHDQGYEIRRTDMSDTDNADFDPEHPDLQHEVDEHPGEATDDTADTAPPEGEEPDPGELPKEIPEAE